MKLLFFSDNFPPESNALTARLYEHATYWIKAGHKVTVVTCAPNFPEGKLMAGYRNRWRQVEDMDGIRVVRVKSYMSSNSGFLKRTLDFMSFMATGAFFGMFERKPDIVAASSPQFFTAIAGWLVAAVKRRPFVLEIRDLWPDAIVELGVMKPNMVFRALGRIEKFLYRRASAIVTVTEGFKLRISTKGIDPKKIGVVVNGVDLSHYSPRAPDATLLEGCRLTGKFVVGFIGTHGIAHALHTVLDAATLLGLRSDIVFVFAGGGARREMVEDEVRVRGLTNVRLVPRQPRDAVPALWSVCDLALAPYRDTPLYASVIPARIFEAMGMGVPLLLSLPTGEATGLVVQVEAGVCVKPEDPQALADTICRLADDPARITQLQAAAKVAAPRFSRETQAMRMEAIFRRVCDP